MNVKRIDLAALRDECVNPIHVFICCASYEQRCLSVAANLPVESVQTALILENMDLARYVDANAQILRTRFGEKAVPVPIDSTSPLQTADAIHRALVSYPANEATTYLVDVTTFTHEALLILLKLLAINAKNEDSIQIAYASALCYGGDERAKVEDRWLSKGVEEVRTVLGYAGEHFPSNKTHLIVLVGYEHERASKLIEIIEPHSIALGYGKSGTETAEKNREANEHFLRLVQKTTIGCENVKIFEIFCDDPIRTRDAIVNVAQEALPSNILLAPMNNKLTTIGAALAARTHDEIQICYAQASLYNYMNYSQPGSTCYLLDIPECFQ